MPRRNIFKKIIKIKEQEAILNIDDEEENFNEQISLQNDKHDDNIDLRWSCLDKMMNMMKRNYYYG